MLQDIRFSTTPPIVLTAVECKQIIYPDSGKTYAYTNALRKGQKYYWRARAFEPGDTSKWSSIWDFTVYTKYEIMQPADGSTGPLTMFWTRGAGSNLNIEYLFEADTTPDFNSSNYRFVNQDSRFYLDSNLFDFGKTVYWRSTAVSPDGDTLEWTDVHKYTFYTKPDFHGGTSIYQIYPEYPLSWSSTKNADVIFQLDTVSDFSSSSMVEWTLDPGTLRDTLRDLDFDQYYYLRMRAGFNGNHSEWSDTRRLYVRAKPFSISPKHDAEVNSLLPQLSWNSFNGALTQVELYSDSLMTSLILDTITSERSFYLSDTLNFNQKVFWRLRHMHARDTSVWVDTKFSAYGGGVVIYSPWNRATNVDVLTTFRFRPETWATGYILEIDTGETFNETPSSYRQTITDFYTQSIYLQADAKVGYGTTSVWRVTAIRGADTASPSRSQYFTTKSIPTPSFPPNNYVGIGTQTNALIKLMIGTDSVEWQLDTTNQFNSPLLATGKDVHVEDDFFDGEVNINLPGELRFETRYFWRVRLMHEFDTSEWTTPFNFTTTQRPWLRTPKDKATGVSSKPTLEWGVQGSSSSLRYQYQIARDSFFTGAPIKTLPAESSSEVVESCDYATRYYWRARAVHARDTSMWSPIWSFHTETKPTMPGVALYQPINGAKNVPTSEVDLLWYHLNQAETYDVQIAGDATFDPIISSGNTPGAGVVFRNMQPGKTYYWRVRGRSADIIGQWSFTWRFTTAGTSSTEQVIQGQKISIYPNPANDLVHLEGAGSYTYELYENTGKLIRSGKVQGGNTTLNVSDLGAGLYRLNLISGDEILSHNLMIQH